MYRIKIDSTKGIKNTLNPRKGNSLQTCFNLFKLTKRTADGAKAVMYRALGKVTKLSEETDTATGLEFNLVELV